MLHMITIEGKAERFYEVKKVSVWSLPWRVVYKSVKYILGLIIETREINYFGVVGI